MPERRSELYEALLSEITSSFITEVVVPPVRPGVDGALFVVELGIQEHQAINLGWSLGRIVTTDTTTEAGAKQTDTSSPRDFAYIRQRHPDVVKDGGQRQLFLSAVALTMAAEIKTQADNTGLPQSSGQPREEAALLTRDATTVNQDDRLRIRLSRTNQCSAEVQTIEGADGDGCRFDW